MNRSKHIVLKNVVAILFSVLILSAGAVAQEEVVSVDTTLVRLNVGVVDAGGRAITTLNRNDFSVYENDVKQTITRFEPTVAPFSLVMLLDTSGSTLGFRQTMIQSAQRFVDALAPDDRVAVVEFNDQTELLTDFTSNRKDIYYAISIANGRGKTQLYRALDFALEKLAKEGSRRKAVVVLTDGIDTAVREQDRSVLSKISDETQLLGAIKPETSNILNRFLNRADQQGVTVYPLALPTGDPSKLADPTPIQVAMFTVARERLNVLANRTGGRVNTINRLEEMGRLYAAVAADLRTLYSVEYEPAGEAGSGSKWRTIRIEVNKPALVVRTRPGYFAK